jgi:molybdopterin synthase catalytic subunit
VQVKIRLFAGLRERAGTGRLELEDVATAGDVWARLAELFSWGDEPSGLMYAVNREYVDRSQPLSDGDEVALIPPVSGGAHRLTPEPLDAGHAIAEVSFPECGAIASFIGTVRNRSRDRDVIYLDYEAFEEMAETMLDELGSDLTSKFSLRAIAIHHRVGRVAIGEPSVVIAASAPHRADALDACREAIETLKATIPLWKKEVYAGGEEWIGRGS